MNYPALQNAVKWYQAHGYELPADLCAQLAKIGILPAPERVQPATKALQDFDNTLTRIVSIYLNDLRTHPGLTGATFGIDFANAIEAGLNEAWRLGLRENDAEMTDEMQVIVDEAAQSQRQYIPDFAAYLTQIAGTAETMGEAITQAQGRLDLWINQYESLRNQAIVMSADEKTKLIWQLGATEQHCQSCAELDGVVAYAREWDEAEIRPQNAPNAVLACGGWKCDCSLTPTTERHTRNAADKLDRIRQAGIRR
jgi:hypothetical protein